MIRADVFVAERLPAGIEDPVVTALTEAGLQVRARTWPTYRDGGLSFLIMIALPLQAFLTAFGTAAGSTAYERLKTAIRGLTNRAQAATTPLVLQDQGTGLAIVLDHDLPDGALAQLQQLDLTTFRHGPLHYDRHHRRWRSTADEAAG